MPDAQGLTDQLKLEEKAKRIRASPIDETKTVKEVFGDWQEWTFQLGLRRFLLNPLTGEWFVCDPVHETWISTEYHTGEVRFIPKGKYDYEAQKVGGEQEAVLSPAELAASSPPLPTEKISSSPTVCPSCNAALPRGHKFCGKCGMKVTVPELPMTGLPDQPDQKRHTKTAGTPHKKTHPGIPPAAPPSPPVAAEEMPKTARVCPSCHAPLPPGHRFCGRCGTEVDGPVSSS
jgi:ribosomal protein L40E